MKSNYVTSLEQRYKIAVDALINIAKGGCFYPSKKEARTVLQRLVYKTPNDNKSVVFDPKARREIKKILEI